MIATTPTQIRELLLRSNTVAMVGASDNPLRPSYTVFSYLRTQSPYRVAPINPKLDSIDGVSAYASLAAYAAENGAPDVVDVFRRPSEALAVVEEALAIGARAIWFQYGVIDAAAIERADKAGMFVVVDRCMKVEYARWCGGLSAGGLNSGVISSRRNAIR